MLAVDTIDDRMNLFSVWMRTAELEQIGRSYIAGTAEVDSVACRGVRKGLTPGYPPDLYM